MEAIGAAVALFSAGVSLYASSRKKKQKDASDGEFGFDSDDFEADELGLNVLYEPHGGGDSERVE
jgi:hypothetical protein